MAKRLNYRFYQVYWSALDWLFPPNCGGCGKTGTRWCPGCHASVQKIAPPLCPKCGQKQPRAELCVRCQKTAPGYTALRSWAVFDGKARNALHQLKYRRNVGLGEMLARSLVELVQSEKWIIDLIIPVPLGLARLAERGYNQSSLLARPLSLALNVPYRPQLLTRAKETRSQVGLTVAERRLNVSGAFIAHPTHVAEQRVLLVDDVTTSGSTLEACAEALFTAGARQVYGLTFARAVFKSPLLSDQLIPES
jgi:competence protein ComFC